MINSIRQASAEESLVAVAANFLPVAHLIQATLNAATDHRILITSGSSGQLYAQIRLGSPVDVFVSADQSYLDRLEADGFVISNSRFTYALGRLALVSHSLALPKSDLDVSNIEHNARVAIPNPNVAPYGLAAQEALSAIGLNDRETRDLIMGANVSQTYAIVRSGNAQLGIVALSTVLAALERDRLAYRVIPSHMHSKISQDAALLIKGKKNAAAISFLNFLKSDSGQQLLLQHGYELP